MLFFRSSFQEDESILRNQNFQCKLLTNLAKLYQLSVRAHNSKNCELYLFSISFIIYLSYFYASFPGTFYNPIQDHLQSQENNNETREQVKKIKTTKQ